MLFDLHWARLETFDSWSLYVVTHRPAFALLPGKHGLEQLSCFGPSRADAKWFLNSDAALERLVRAFPHLCSC